MKKSLNKIKTYKYFVHSNLEIYNRTDCFVRKSPCFYIKPLDTNHCAL